MIDKSSVIFACTENARIKIRDLAKMLNKSPQSIKYKVSALEKSGILKEAYCIFDYSYFDLILFRVYFKGAYVGDADKQKIIMSLLENEYVASIYELSGEFDLVVEFIAENPSRFNKVFKNLIDAFPSMRHYKVALNIVTHLYPHAYLLSNDFLLLRIPQQMIVGGDRRARNFTKNEMLVIRSLLENPKARIVELSKMSKINHKTAGAVMKSLAGSNVLKGVKYILDRDKIGIHSFRMFLKLHNVSKEREDDLMAFMLRERGIVEVNKTVGDWDMEIDVESADKSVNKKIVSDIKEKFKDIIETFNIMEFYQYHKRSYLPRCIFSDIGRLQQAS